ncbi:hypothetical protein CBM2633_B40113 [Cupriavidus taiwanensis]|nr:hypothetical protein CBM2633_B40113 [Cupriavidus taiwanensis]
MKRSFSQRAEAAPRACSLDGFVTFPLKTAGLPAVNLMRPPYPKQHPIPPPFRANGNTPTLR